MTLLRACLFNLYFLLVTLAMGVGAFWVRLFARDRALPYAAAWCRVVLRGLGVICGVRIVLSGAEHLPRGPVLIASQHQSAFDTLVWLTLVPRPAYVMKRELTRLPLVGPMLLLSGMIPVDREAGGRALRRLLHEVDEAVADDRQIVIFPEGTRAAAGEILPLQPGIAALAVHAGLPVLPVATDSGRCWSRRAFVKRSGTIHIAIAAPIPPARPGSTRGGGRAALLEAIRAAWRQEEARIVNLTLVDEAVDKSVGAVSRGM